MARIVNAEARQARAAEIVTAARAHLTEEGIDGFSLRAIARRLDLAPNSLYNYYPSLDDLITALILDAFGRLADAVAAANKGPTWQNRFAAVCLAYRRWAVANQTDYNLIFGSPIPGYHASSEQTSAASIRSFAAGLDILIGAWRDGMLTIPRRYQTLPPNVAASLMRSSTAVDPELPIALSYLMFVAWSRMHGMIMLENHGHDDEALGDPQAFFAHNVDCLIEELGFHLP